MMLSCTRCLRAALASLLALSLAAGLAGPLAAETQPAKEKQRAKRSAPPRADGSLVRAPLPEPYVELNANKMPFGSMAWWEQMRREGRLGGETP